MGLSLKSNENTCIAIIFLILGAPQAAYLIPSGGFIFLFSAFILFLMIVLPGLIKFTYSSADWIFISIIFAMICLGFALLIFGKEGQFTPRNLFSNGVFELIVVMLTLFALKSKTGAIKLALSFAILVCIESIIVLGQFTFLNFGIGFSKIAGDGNIVGMLTGSMANPNNSAAYIGILLLAVSAYFTVKNNTKTAILIMIMALPAIFLTLSRTIIVFWVLNLLAILASNKNACKVGLMTLWVFLLAAFLFSVFNQFDYQSNDILSRSVDRIMSLTSVGEDGSIGFRYIAHLRLIENMTNLGFGTFKDLDYSEFFDAADPQLMNINPHSYIVEYSFLFGYFGFIIIFTLFFYIIKEIFLSKDLPLPFKLVAAIGVLFIQAVPSSFLALNFFVAPFLFIGRLKK